MKKFLTLGLLSFLLVLPVSAQEPEIAPAAEAAELGQQVASVNAVVNSFSEVGGTFKVSFTLLNELGVQPGIRYGLELVENTPYGPVLADEYYSSEVLTLEAGQSVERSLNLKSRQLNGGQYTLVLVAKNEFGFPFAYVPVTEKAMPSTAGDVALDLGSCYLTIRDDDTKMQYRPAAGLTINQQEDILLSTCAVTNNSDTTLEVIPVFTTTRFASIGALAPAIGGDNALIPIQPGKTSIITSIVPTVDLTPGFYTLKLAYGNSNPVTYRYIVEGVAAAVQNIVFDKTTYKNGETATLNLVWAGMSSHREDVKAGNGQVIDKPMVEVGLQSAAGAACSEQTKLALDPTAPTLEIFLPVTSDCAYPVASLTLSDANTKRLHSATVANAAAPVAYEEGEGAALDTSDKAAASTSLQLLVLALLAAMALAAGLIFYLRRRATHIDASPDDAGTGPSSTSLSLMLLVGLSLAFANTAEAATLLVPGEGMFDAPQNYLYVTVNLDKTDYLQGENITVTAAAYYSHQPGDLLVEHRLNALGGYVEMFDGTVGNPSNFSSIVVAPVNIRQHYLRVYGYDTNAGFNRVYTDLKFNVVPGPLQCADGIDNGDGDGLIDYPADPDCLSASDNDESTNNCTWNAIENVYSSPDDWLQPKYIYPVPGGETACTAGVAFGPGSQTCGSIGAALGMSSNESQGMSCYLPATETVNPTGFAPEYGFCYARGLVSDCGSLNPPANPPTNFTATTGATPICGGKYIDLAWDSVQYATTYELQIDGGASLNVGNVLAYAHSGLVDGSSHTYRVRAVNDDGASAWSAAINRTAPVACPTFPDLRTTQVSVITPGAYTEGVPMTVEATVRNFGTNTTGAGFSSVFRYQWGGTGGAWLSFPVNTDSSPTLAANAEDKPSVTFTPDQDGTLYFQFCADSSNVINEGDAATESNNCRTIAAGVAVAAAAPPAPSGACTWGESFQTVQFANPAPANSACSQGAVGWQMDSYAVCDGSQVDGVAVAPGDITCYYRDGTMLDSEEANPVKYPNPPTVIAECIARVMTPSCVPPPLPPPACTWELVTDPVMNDYKEVRDCVGFDPGFTTCNAPNNQCGFNGGWFLGGPRPACPGGISDGDASAQANGYVCWGGITPSPVGIPVENSICYAKPVYRTVCTASPSVQLDFQLD